MRVPNTIGKLLLFSAAVVTASTLSARSLLYYYDFDDLPSNATAAGCVNRGTGTGTLTQQNQNGTALSYTTSAAFGGAALAESPSGNAIWLGDGSASLGCGTTHGFTISFWAKITNSHGAWGDFIGFRVGGTDYRCEFITGNTTAFTMYTSTGTGVFAGSVSPAANEWKHMAFVFSPSSSNVGKCELYIDGTKVGNVSIQTAGDLQRIYIGSWVLNGSSVRKYTNTNTCLDELAVFDYPVTFEQLKWLTKYRPAQPVGGPGREMPYAYLYNTANDNQRGILFDNAGTGPAAAYRWVDGFSNYGSPGANGSQYCFLFHSNTTWRLDDNSEYGLGGTAGSGFTISFWVTAPNTFATLWRDFFCYRIGDRYSRFEWNASDPPRVFLYRSTSGTGGNFTLVPDVLQHVCCVWNQAENGLDVYVSGTKQTTYTFSSALAASEAVKTFTFGPQCFNENGGTRTTAAVPNTGIDDFAFFNYSLNETQIAWLAASNSPALPPLGIAELTRTLDADGKWYGHLASWTDTANSLNTIYPSCEDTDLTATVTVGNDVTLANDTFVFAKQVTFVKSGASAVALALVPEAGSCFAPEKLVLDGVVLAVSSPYRQARPTMDADFKPGAVEGAEDITVGNAVVDLSAATLTGFTGKVRLTGTSARVKCRAADVANYFVYDSTVYQQTAAGSGIVVIEKTQAISLTEDTIWSNFFTGTGREDFIVDLCGHVLTVGELDVYGRIIDSVGGGEFHVDVADNGSVVNRGVDVTGGIKFVKDGDGAFTAAVKQTYTGGTEVTAGTFFFGTNRNPCGPNEAWVKVDAGATLDMNGLFSTATCLYKYDLAGTLKQSTSTGSNGYNNNCRCFGSEIRLSGDATIQGQMFYFGSPTIPAYVTFNGHTLTMQLSNYVGYGAWRSNDNGTLEVKGSVMEALAGCGMINSGLRFCSGSQLKLNCTFDTGDFRYDAGATFFLNSAATHAVQVFGTYYARDARPPIKMANGSTLDLGGATLPLELTPSAEMKSGTGYDQDARGPLAFNAEAKITLSAGEGLFRNRDKLIDWTEIPNATFELDAASKSRHLKLRVKDDGLYIEQLSMCILVR